MAASSAPTPAHAAICGSVYGDSGNNDIVLGEQASYFYYGGQRYYYGLGKLMACTTLGGTRTSTLVTTCTTSTPSGDHVFVSAYAGNDRLAPNTLTRQCELGAWMMAWDHSVFSFGIAANMGTGSDRAYGSNHSDQLYSNVPGTFFPWNPTPADSANDWLCGYGGNDSLYGDQDDSATYQERLWGGAGTDYCNGGYDGNTYDQANCETVDAATSTSSNFDCGFEIPDLWDGY